MFVDRGIFYIYGWILVFFLYVEIVVSNVRESCHSFSMKSILEHIFFSILRETKDLLKMIPDPH